MVKGDPTTIFSVALIKGKVAVMAPRQGAYPQGPVAGYNTLWVPVLFGENPKEKGI